MNQGFHAIELCLALIVPVLAWWASPAVAWWQKRSGVMLNSATAAAGSLALVLLWLQLGGMLLGFCHLLAAPWVVSWVLVGLAAGGCSYRKSPGVVRLSPAGVWLPCLLSAAIVGVLLLEATVPSWFQDDVVYHLSLPRFFAQRGGYAQPDDNIFTAFPLGWESILAMLHTLGAAPDHFPPLNPRLITVWVAVGAALATAGLARELGARRSEAAWAGALLLLVPTYAQFATLCYVEPYLILLTVLAVTLLVRGCRGDDSAVVPVAVLAGAAASVKYTGLAVCGGLLVAWLIGLRGSEPARRNRVLVTFIGVGALVGCPFYVRNLIERGNPVFPLAYDLFGGRGWDSWRAWGYSRVLSDYGHGRSVTDYVLLPLRLLTAREPRSGFESSLGPAVATGAVVSIVASFPRFRTRLFPDAKAALLVAVLVFIWSLFWAVTTQQGRMFLTTVPLLLSLVAAAITGVRSARPRVAIAAQWLVVSAALAWAVPDGWSWWERQGTSLWVTGKLSSDQALSVLLRDTFPIERELESVVPPGGKVWLVWMHNYTYYLRRPWRADQIFEDERFSNALDASDTPAAFARKLAADGISAVLLNERFFLTDDNADRGELRTPRLKQRFTDVVAAGVLVPVRRDRDVVLYRVAGI